MTRYEGIGALAQMLQTFGRGRDTILAHITPEEAKLLKKRGGAGTTNKITGLLEFEGGEGDGGSGGSGGSSSGDSGGEGGSSGASEGSGNGSPSGPSGTGGDSGGEGQYGDYSDSIRSFFSGLPTAGEFGRDFTGLLSKYLGGKTTPTPTPQPIVLQDPASLYDRPQGTQTSTPTRTPILRSPYPSFDFSGPGSQSYITNPYTTSQAPNLSTGNSWTNQGIASMKDFWGRR